MDNIKQNNMISLAIEGMHCASCVSQVEKKLNAVPGVLNASVNLAHETAQIEYSEQFSLAGLLNTLTDTGYPAKTIQATLDVKGMACASCVKTIENTLTAIDGVVRAEVNLVTESAAVEYLAAAISETEIASVLSDAGYPSSIRTDDKERNVSHSAARITELRNLTIAAAVLAIPVFVLEMGSHLLPAFHHFISTTIGSSTSQLIQFLLTTLILLGPGRQFYTSGIPALIKGAPTMNSLVALGTLAAYGFSVVTTFTPMLLPQGSANVYFESAAIIVLLVLLGKYLEARAKGQAGDAIRQLILLQPATGRVMRDDVIVDIDVVNIVLGDIVHMRPGEKFPTDGIVLDGGSYVDESMITGESNPVKKSKGDTVVSGTINGSAVLSYQASAVGNETLLAQIISMVEQAQAAKLPIQAVVDRITEWFVPVVIFLAVITTAAWFFLASESATGLALVAGVSVLIIACPCAMGLATPMSIMVGSGMAAKMGVLFRQGDALQKLQDADILALDKTGTLTEGRPELVHFDVVGNFTDERILQLVAAVEALSEHPIASAIVRAAKLQGLNIPDATHFISQTGYGVKAQVDGHEIMIGAQRMMARSQIPIGSLEKEGQSIAKRGITPFYVAIDGEVAALIGVADPIKPSSQTAIDAIKHLGLTPVMITGDNENTARAIAAELGIVDIIANVLPNEKMHAIEKLQTQGHTVTYVGDGINDAPALACADVGIAIGTGTDVAIETADLVLMSGDLNGVVNAFDISQHTMRNIRQNLFWAFAYNIVLIPIAAGLLYPFTGTLLSPILAATAMSLSSLFVVSNALRLKWIKPLVISDVLKQKTDLSKQFLVSEAK
ncbi:MAG: heavy metal translocating P-type ATPase [Granulosicoccus sp.]